MSIHILSILFIIILLFNYSVRHYSHHRLKGYFSLILSLIDVLVVMNLTQLVGQDMLILHHLNLRYSKELTNLFHDTKSLTEAGFHTRNLTVIIRLLASRLSHVVSVKVLQKAQGCSD